MRTRREPGDVEVLGQAGIGPARHLGGHGPIVASTPGPGKQAGQASRASKPGKQGKAGYARTLTVRGGDCSEEQASVAGAETRNRDFLVTFALTEKAPVPSVVTVSMTL